MVLSLKNPFLFMSAQKRTRRPQASGCHARGRSCATATTAVCYMTHMQDFAASLHEIAGLRQAQRTLGGSGAAASAGDAAAMMRAMPQQQPQLWPTQDGRAAAGNASTWIDSTHLQRVPSSGVPVPSVLAGPAPHAQLPHPAYTDPYALLERLRRAQSARIDAALQRGAQLGELAQVLQGQRLGLGGGDGGGGRPLGAGAELGSHRRCNALGNAYMQQTHMKQAHIGRRRGGGGGGITPRPPSPRSGGGSSGRNGGGSAARAGASGVMAVGVAGLVQRAAARDLGRAPQSTCASARLYMLAWQVWLAGADTGAGGDHGIAN
jgi:hypothetical protein